MHQVLVDDRDGRVGLDHAGGDGAGLVGGELHLLGLIGVELHDQALDVEDDVGDIFHHAGEAGEFVLRALEADVGDGRAFQDAEQDAPQAVADGGAEAAFERLGGKFAVGFGGDVLVANDARGQFQSSPTNSHDYAPCRPRTGLREVTAPTVGGHLSSASPSETLSL